MNDDLITQLEVAIFGGYELDAAIAEAIGLKSLGEQSVLRDPFGKSDERISRPSYPMFTTSLDTALTLMPKDHFGELHFGDHINDLAECSIWRRGETYGHQGKEAGYAEDINTAPLALCIAALKARQASGATIGVIDAKTVLGDV